MPSVLELRDVTKRFGSHLAVDRVTLAAEQGSITALLGPSGCGKTTTLRIIAGFERPDSGEVRLRGAAIEHLKPYQRPVSTVFQSYALFPHLTARGNIEFGLRQRGRGNGDMAERVRRVVELLELGGKEDRKPAQLSGGERQRVALARSLVLEPEVLLLDEPFAALDPNLRKQVRTELKVLQRRIGTAFVFVTHDREEALSLSDSIAVMNAGRLEQTGTPHDLYTQPRTRFVAGFLGAVNWVNGVGVRPEVTRISRAAPPGGARAAAAVVERTTFLGSCTQVHARLNTGEAVAAEVPLGEDAFREGELVHLWWRPQDEITSAR